MKRSDKPIPPHNLEAERSLLGACLLESHAVERSMKIVGPSDFFSAAHQTIYTEILQLHASGKSIDAVTLSERLGLAGHLDAIGGSAYLISLQTGTPAIGSAGHYAEIVLRHSTARQIAQIAMDAYERAFAQIDDPNSLIEEMVSSLKSASINIGSVPDDLFVLDDFLDQPNENLSQWVIPGLVRQGWRVMIVAAEGVGKSVLMRQIAICAAQGIHPLDYSVMEPVRTLIVDLENPQDSILGVCNPIRDRALTAATRHYDPSRAWLWWRDAGINIRNRSDRTALETVIAHVRPDLVCLGPLYKVYEVNARENDEQAAREVMVIFDDLRKRYNFGLILEHHAPKESGGKQRSLMPYGSSLWLRWPEIGIKLHPESESLDTLVLGRWRGDRLDNGWPKKIRRSHEWPWRGDDDDGPRNVGGPGYPPRLPPPEGVNAFLDNHGYSPEDEPF